MKKFKAEITCPTSSIFTANSLDDAKAKAMYSLLTSLEVEEVKDNKPKPLILIVGKSGSGKTTLADKLTELYGLKQLRSNTTRPPRFKGEGGHSFVTEKTYEADKEHGTIKYETTINGYHYWCRQCDVDKADIYVIDPDTAVTCAYDCIKSGRKVIFVMCVASDIERAIRMLKRRNVYKEEVIYRLKTEKNWDIIGRLDIIAVKHNCPTMCTVINYNSEGIDVVSAAKIIMNDIGGDNT